MVVGSLQLAAANAQTAGWQDYYGGAILRRRHYQLSKKTSGTALASMCTHQPSELEVSYQKAYTVTFTGK